MKSWPGTDPNSFSGSASAMMAMAGGSGGPSCSFQRARRSPQTSHKTVHIIRPLKTLQTAASLSPKPSKKLGHNPRNRRPCTLNPKPGGPGGGGGGGRREPFWRSQRPPGTPRCREFRQGSGGPGIRLGAWQKRGFFFIGILIKYYHYY